MSKTQCVFWLGFWAIAFGNVTACAILAPGSQNNSIECVKAGGDWSWGQCSRTAKPKD